MKKLLTSSIIFSILMITACSAQQSIEVTGTRFAKVTVTLPSPTETPTPSPESLLPQEVKEKFELAGVDLANMQNAKYDKDGLHITLPSGEVIVLTNDQLQKGMYNGQDNVLQYRDEANQNAVYAFDKETGKWGVKVEQIDQMSDEEKLATAPEIEGYAKWKSAERFVIYEAQDGAKNLAFDLTKAEKREIKQYPTCKIERFYDCVIPFEELKNGDYWLWLNTLSQPFDPSKVKDVPLVTDTFRSVTEKTEIIYDTSTVPNFNDPTIVPFRRDGTSGVVYYEYNGVISYGAIRPIEFYDKNNPTNNKWVITIESLYYADINNITPQTNQYLQWTIDTWKYWMHITPILTTTLGSAGLEDPLVKSTFENYPDIHARFENFLEGDVSALSAPDIFLLTHTARNTGNRYK